jgi:hypothetical protein
MECGDCLREEGGVYPLDEATGAMWGVEMGC